VGDWCVVYTLVEWEDYVKGVWMEDNSKWIPEAGNIRYWIRRFSEARRKGDERLAGKLLKYAVKRHDDVMKGGQGMR